MTEAPYLFFSFLTLLYVHRQSLRSGTWPVQSVVLAGILSVITFHVRVPAISLMGAVGVWLLLNRQYRNAFIYGAMGVFFGVLPWLVWTKTQTPVLSDLNYPLVNAYSNYGLEFWTNMMSAKSYLGGVQQVLQSIVNKVLTNMMPLLTDFVAMFPKYKPWKGLIWLFMETCLYGMLGVFLIQIVHTVKLIFFQGRFHARAFSIPALYTIFYILLITFWNYEDQITRFLIVMTPLLWLYLYKPFLQIPRLSAASVLGHAGGTDPLPARHIWRKRLILGIIVVFTADMALYLSKSAYDQIHMYRSEHFVARGRGREYLWGEYEDSFRWIKKNIPITEPIGAASDVVFGLYTDRPTFYLFFASIKMKNGVPTPDAIPVLMQNLDRKKVAYLVAEPHMQARQISTVHQINSVMEKLITTYPKRFKMVYATPHHMIFIFKILPLTAN
jgi:hypothetical protein